MLYLRQKYNQATDLTIADYNSRTAYFDGINQSLLLESKAIGERFKGDLTARTETIKGIASAISLLSGGSLLKMAVLKIPQSQQQVRAAGQSGNVDIRLPLSLARQQGAAFSSLGKVYEDIYKEQRDIEDKKEFYKITKEVGLDIAKISNDVSKNTDLDFAHKTFDELTQPEKYENFLKDKNKNVQKLFDQWLLKTKDKEYSTIANKVIQKIK